MLVMLCEVLVTWSMGGSTHFVFDSLKLASYSVTATDTVRLLDFWRLSESGKY